MIFLLLIIYQIKHFLCDFPLQGRYMLGKFKPGNEWILPLLAHASVHGVATFLIALCFKTKIAFWVALFDMAIHFTMDRIKASPNMLGRFKALSGTEYMALAKEHQNAGINGFLNLDLKEFAKQKEIEKTFRSNTYFWWSLGLDQGVHHLTHYAIIWCLL